VEIQDLYDKEFKIIILKMLKRAIRFHEIRKTIREQSEKFNQREKTLKESNRKFGAAEYN